MSFSHKIQYNSHVQRNFTAEIYMKKKTVREMTSYQKLWHGLTFRSSVLVALIMLFMGLIILASGFVMFFASALDEYRANTCTYAKAEAVALDQDAMKAKTREIIDIYDSLPEDVTDHQEAKDYRRHFVSTVDTTFRSLQESLRTMQNGMGLKNAFIVALDEKKNRMIYLVDSDPRPASFCFPGTWDEYTHKEIVALAHGGTTSRWERLLGLSEEHQATITNLEQYGLRCTGGETLYETDNYSVILCLDEKLDHLMEVSYMFMRRFLILLAGAIVIGTAITIIGMRRKVAKPLVSMASAARHYAEDKNKGISAPNHFEKLDIKTSDEIDELSIAMKEMEQSLIEYEKNLRQITAKQERINAELDLATRIQRDSLPNTFPAFPDRGEFDIYASMDPAKEVGGDFYDFLIIDEDHLGFLIADVAGKGIPAALFMMISKLILDNALMNGLSPAEALEHANNTIGSRNQEEMFVTVWIAVLEISTGIVTTSNAGHEKPALIRADGQVELLEEKHGFVVGGMAGMQYKEQQFKLETGDKLFVYTDGVPEATDADETLYGTDRMVAALKKDPTAIPQQVLKIVRADVDEFVGEAEQFDDLTMLCLQYHPDGSAD